MSKTSYSGNTSTATDQLGNLRKSTTDGAGRLSQVVEYPVNASLSPTYITNYGYDPLGNLTSVNQGSGCTPLPDPACRSFGYDMASRLSWSSQPEGNYNYWYDNNGNVLTKQDGRAVRATSAYDGLNRPKQVSYNDNITPTVNYTYDTGTGGLGHLSSVAVAGRTTTSYLSFDSMGEVRSSSQGTGGQTYSFSYVYNLAGAVTGETYPSGRVITTAYDQANRPHTVTGTLGGVATAYLKDIEYMPHGALNYMQYGNGLFPYMTYDSRLRQSAQYNTVNNDPSQYLLYQSYGWNANGSLKSQTSATGNRVPYASLHSFAQSFTYDGVNRVTSVNENNGGWTRSFSYDKFGNMWVPPGSTGITPAGNTPGSNVYNNKNQIGSLAYDLAGNQLTVNGNNATYDGESRVIAVTETPAAGGGSESFDYDGLGQRVQKTVSGGATTVYVYDAFGQVAAEYSTASNPAPCSTCYLVTDALGSTRLVTDQNANPVTRHDFAPFGEEIAANTAGRDGTWGSTTDVTQKFTGQVRDPETGLDYFNARYYAPALGRFTSPDPGNAGADPSNPQTWNAYAYVNNNPLSFVDPSGQSWGDIFGGIGSFFSGLGNALGLGADNCGGAMFCITHTENSPSGPAGSYAWWMSGGWQLSTGGGGRGGGVPPPQKPTPAPVPPKYVIQANKGALVLEKVLPNACMVSGTYHYSTGMNGNTDYKVAGQGPLPPGNYTLHPYEISPAGFFRKYLDPRDWGDFRVTLHPDPGTNTYGRSGFFLHGGYLRHGSEGCLKVEGSNQNNLFQQLQGAADPVPVQVTVP